MVIVAAIDRNDRATDIIHEAATVAEAFDDVVHGVHVLSRSDFVDLGRTHAEEGDAVSMDQVRKISTQIATESIQEADVPAEAVGLVGDPANRIVDYAEDHDARYVIIAPRKRSPVGKAVFGSVAQSVLLNTTIPVISITEQ